MDQRGKRTFRKYIDRETKRRQYHQKERVTNCVKYYDVKYEKKKVSSRLVIRRSSVTFVRAFFQQ